MHLVKQSWCVHFESVTSDASIHVGRKEDIPELGRGSEELDGNERAFLIELRGAHDVDFHFLLGFRIFEDEFCARGQTFGEDDHAAGGADRVGEAGDRLGLVLRLVLKVSNDGYAQQNTLRAPALFGGGLALQGRAHCVAGPEVHPRLSV
jgi:hypothetical protein